MKNLEKEFEEWLKSCPVDYNRCDTYAAVQFGKLIKHRHIDFSWSEEHERAMETKICIN